MISAVILSHEGAKDIKKTIASVEWCDEVLTIDETEFPLNGNYAAKRNYGLEKARGEWVLFVDSDEIINERLKEEIQNIGEDYDGYYLRRRDNFFGSWLTHGEVGNVRLLRLGRKGAGIWKRPVHEVWDIKKAGVLKNPLSHFPHKTIKILIDQFNFYSVIDAKVSHRFSYGELFFKPPGKFGLNYFLRLGFLDGLPGFVMAFMMSFYSLMVRVNEYELRFSQSA